MMFSSAGGSRVFHDSSGGVVRGVDHWLGFFARFRRRSWGKATWGVDHQVGFFAIVAPSHCCKDDVNGYLTDEGMSCNPGVKAFHRVRRYRPSR